MLVKGAPGVRSWGLNSPFPSDFRMATRHFHPHLFRLMETKTSYPGFPQPRTQQRVGSLQVCARSCRMPMKFNGQMMACGRQLVPIGLTAAELNVACLVILVLLKWYEFEWEKGNIDLKEPRLCVFNKRVQGYMYFGYIKILVERWVK